MQAFRDCLEDCGLTDLGFVGQRYTWCNERLGTQRTLVRLDRFVANKGWKALFPEAMVFHMSMPASDHCLLELSLKKRGHPKPTKKRFFFESMWTRDDRCREVIETAWDPLRECPMFQLQDRIRSCQIHLQEWNRATFGNVTKALKQKQSRLQHLEALNLLHETAEEIENLRNKINEDLTKEEMMCNQTSRAIWMKCEDRNTSFFHATATQRQRKNRIEGLCDPDGAWCDNQEGIEKIILDYFSEIYSTGQPYI
ncbi:uncharacterized protein LOC112039498 [Quercus suber]|uniref:uncharacterized protein LOC112039498 n=1 Tax=Quercus suber TaxID=58331 RepID=UPI000CE17754|nr:uncharacterized protein LOC112039498 [Quercus suber]